MSAAEEPPSIATERTPLLGEAAPNSGTPPQEADESNAGNTDDADIAEEPGTAKLLLILGSTWLGVFLAALDSTIIATLSAPISTSFNSFKLLSWLATAYFIANAALQPLSGRLTDIFSRRAGLVFSNIFFAVGTLICGVAQSEGVMILGRVIAGMGGGGLTAIATFVSSDLVPLRRRGLWQGFGNLCFGLGSGMGGVFGGWINDVWGWRNAFLIQLPFIALSCILAMVTIDIPVKDKNMSRLKRVDFLGAFTLVAALVLLLVGLNSGGNIVPWSHPLVLSSLSLSVLFLFLFIYVEDKVSAEPIIPVRLLLNRTVLAACMTNWFETMSVFALLYYAPIYFQVLGFSATQAGLRLVPQSVGVAVGSLGTGILMRATGRYYVLNCTTEFILILSYALIAATLDLQIALWPPYIYFFLTGMGYGGMLTVTLLALISAVDHEHQAVITSASYAFRSTGSTVGITVASAVFQNLLKARLWERFGSRTDAGEIIDRIRDSIDEIKHLPEDWKEGVLLSYMDALRGVWYVVLGIGILGATASLLMREHVLHKNLARR